MKIAIMYIAIGKYKVFSPKFYQSCNEYFLADDEKTYFVFTDDVTDSMFDKKDIVKTYQKNLGWPDNTLKRFHMFLQLKDTLKNYDFIFFFNADLQFITTIKREEIAFDNRLTACLHPWYYGEKTGKFTYDRNPKSKAYIPYGKGDVYVFGALQGGASKLFISAMETMRKNTDIDEKNGIIALWHDESHWNKYVFEHSDNVVCISPAYCYPYPYQDQHFSQFTPKIVKKDKILYLKDIENIKNSGYKNLPFYRKIYRNFHNYRQFNAVKKQCGQWEKNHADALKNNKYNFKL